MGPDQGRLEQSGKIGRVAYVMSRFPQLTETFVLFEMLELEALGFEIDIFPLRLRAACVSAPRADRFCAAAWWQACSPGSRRSRCAIVVRSN